MDVKEKIKRIMILEEIRKNPKRAEENGLVDASTFDGERIKTDMSDYYSK